MESNEGRKRNQSQASRENNQAGTDNAKKHGRLTPEERQALRRQINEASQDIYLTKP